MDTSPEHPAAPPLADAGLRCPKCEYNLTGLAEDRCPECGQAFDRERLRMLAAGHPGPIPGWDDAPDSVTAFVSICLRTWFLPVRLGREFPEIHDPRSLKRFKRASLIVAICCYGVTQFALVFADLPLKVALIIAAWAGAAFCELWADTMLTFCLGRHQGTPRRVDAWTGLVGVNRSFLVLSGLYPAVMAASRSAPVGDILGAALVFWWSASLTIAALSRGHACWRALPILFLLGIGVVLAGLLGLFVSVACSEILASFLT